MKKLVLSKSENQELLEKGSVEIEKNGFSVKKLDTMNTKKLPAPKPPKKLLDPEQKKEIVRLMLWSLPTLLQAIAIGVLLLLFRS